MMQASDERKPLAQGTFRKQARTRHSWRPSESLPLSEFVVVEEARTEHSMAISERHHKTNEFVKKKKKKQLSTMKKAIIADKRERSGEADEDEDRGSGLDTTADADSCCTTAAAASSSPLDTAILNLLVKLKGFHDRAYRGNPIKAKSKRRLVCGLREVERHLLLSTARCVIIAHDLEYVLESERLGMQVAQIRRLCEQHGVPVLRFSKKHKLGKALRMSPFVSAVAVLDYAGAEDLYVAMLDEQRWYERICRILDHEDQSSIFP